MRILFWIGTALALWVAYVWVTGNPRFWARLALVSAQVSHASRAVYNHQKLTLEHSAVHPATGDTITDIEAYLRRNRHGA